MSTVATLFVLARQTTQGRGEGRQKERAYAVSGSVGLLRSLLRQQVFDCVLDPDALVHPLGEV